MKEDKGHQEDIISELKHEICNINRFSEELKHIIKTQ